MGLASQKDHRSKKSSWTVALSLASLVFFNNCTMSPFETSAAEENLTKLRLPSSIAQQTFEFDCANPSKKTEVSTDLETIRLEAKNCTHKIQFKNEKHPQPLVTFPLGTQKIASEFAYLVKGENSFSITVDDQIYKVFVHRF